jgi:hypothetical protein
MIATKQGFALQLKPSDGVPGAMAPEDFRLPTGLKGPQAPYVDAHGPAAAAAKSVTWLQTLSKENYSWS